MTSSLKKRKNARRPVLRAGKPGKLGFRPRSKTKRALRTSRRKFIREGRFFVYILECSDGSYYTGYTNDLEARLKLHNSGRGSKYVRSRRPVKLAFFKKYRYYKHAIKEERRIKTLPRKRKELMVRG